MRPFFNLKPAARVVVIAYLVLAIAGVYVAVQNMPVISGCKFYGECPNSQDTTADTSRQEAL